MYLISLFSSPRLVGESNIPKYSSGKHPAKGRLCHSSPKTVWPPWPCLYRFLAAYRTVCRHVCFDCAWAPLPFGAMEILIYEVLDVPFFANVRLVHSIYPVHYSGCCCTTRTQRWVCRVVGANRCSHVSNVSSIPFTEQRTFTLCTS